MKWLERLFPPLKEPDYKFNGQDIGVVGKIHTCCDYYQFRVVFNSGLSIIVKTTRMSLLEPIDLIKLRELFMNNMGHSYFEVLLPKEVEIKREHDLDHVTTLLKDL